MRLRPGSPGVRGKAQFRKSSMTWTKNLSVFPPPQSVEQISIVLSTAGLKAGAKAALMSLSRCACRVAVPVLSRIAKGKRDKKALLQVSAPDRATSAWNAARTSWTASNKATFSIGTGMQKPPGTPSWPPAEDEIADPVYTRCGPIGLVIRDLIAKERLEQALLVRHPGLRDHFQGCFLQTRFISADSQGMVIRIALAAAMVLMSHAGLLAQTTMIGKFQQHSIQWQGNDSCPDPPHDPVYTTGSASFSMSDTRWTANWSRSRKLADRSLLSRYP